MVAGLRNSPCAFIKKQCSRLATKQIKYCFECPDFPCERLEKLDRRYRDQYGMSMIETLRYVQINGIGKFLKKNEKDGNAPLVAERFVFITKHVAPAGKPVSSNRRFKSSARLLASNSHR